MKKRKIFCAALLFGVATFAFGQKAKTYDLTSPDGSVIVHIEVAAKLRWSVAHKGQQIIAPSAISLLLDDGTVLGDNARVSSAPIGKVNTTFNPINYYKATVTDRYSQITLTCHGNYGIIFRAYDDAVAYRFFTTRKGAITIRREEANFNFTADHRAFIPIQWDYRGGKIFNSSFEALYREIGLSQFPKDSLAFLPLLVDAGDHERVVILEADLEDYPGMYLDLNETGKGLKAVHAPYPLEVVNGGADKMNLIPTSRADYIAKTDGNRSFPWRAIVISESDKDLLKQ